MGVMDGWRVGEWVDGTLSISTDHSANAFKMLHDSIATAW
jgi:hypothetical protein